MAREALAEEIEPISERIERELKKSTALAALRTGTKSLTYSGVGAIAGFALGGDPLIAGGGAVAGKAAEVVTEYLRGLKRRGHNRAVLDLATTFIDKE